MKKKIFLNLDLYKKIRKKHFFFVIVNLIKIKELLLCD